MYNDFKRYINRSFKIGIVAFFVATSVSAELYIAPEEDKVNFNDPNLLLDNGSLPCYDNIHETDGEHDNIGGRNVATENDVRRTRRDEKVSRD